MSRQDADDGRPDHPTQKELTYGDTVSVAPLVQLARQAQRMRAIVIRLFPRDVFRDSAWDMLLELFIAGQQNRVICTKELIFVSRETHASALRRIDRLEEAGMLLRHQDTSDHRRVIVSLTHKGEEAMSAMLRSLIIERSA
jgi:DNA-binding MarR family transcriptional regulator